MKPEVLYDVKEVARFLNVVPRTVRRWCWKNQIRHYRLPGDVLRIEGSVVIAMRVEVSQNAHPVTFPPIARMGSLQR